MQPEVETATSFIRIDEEGILRTRIKDGVEVTERDAVEVFNLYRKWGIDKKKVLQVIEGAGFYVFDDGAQKYASKHGKDFFIASAIIHDALGMRMLFNFFNRFFNPGLPFKMFPSEAKALEWLRSFKKNN